METPLLKIAVVGFGNIGKRHASVIAAHNNCELVAIVDEKASLEMAAQAYDIPYFSSLNELLKSNLAIDIVTIATPNGMHAAQALDCLEAGKHIVVEKPMALSKRDANAIVEKSKIVEKHIFPVVQNRYAAPAVWLKDVVESGTLGKIYLVNINCFWNRDERYYKPGSWHGNCVLDGGTLFTQFSHFIDTLYWLFGDITNIAARFRDFNHTSLTQFEDSGLVQFDFENGGSGTFNYTTSVWGQNAESSLVIIAENGTIKVAGQYMDEIEICHIKNYTVPDVNAWRNVPQQNIPPGAVNHHTFYNNVVKFFNNEKYQLPTAEEAVKVIDIIEKIYSFNK